MVNSRPVVLFISLFFLCFCVLVAPVSAAWTWTDTMVDNEYDAGRWNSIAMNGGNPAISYYVYQPPGADMAGVKYAWYDGAAWNDEVVFWAGDNTLHPGQYTSLAFSGGNPSISWYYPQAGDLYYSKKNGAWVNTRIDNGGVNTGVGRYTSIAFDNAGNPAISYYDVDDADLNFTWYNGAAWIMRDGPPDAGGDVGKFTSLAFNGGNPSISYYDVTNGNLKYVEYAAGAWGAPVAVDTVGDVGWNTSLAFNGGNPSISYYDATNGALKYASRAGGAWTAVTVDNAGDVGRFTSLAFDNSGNPGISYYDVTNTALKYAWNDGTGWQTTTINTTGDLGMYSSLAFNGANPSISYYDWTSSALWYVAGTWAGGGNPLGGGANDLSGSGSLSVGDACAGYASMVEYGRYVNITFHCDNSAISMISLLFNTNISEILVTTTNKDRLPPSIPLINGTGYEYNNIEMFRINLSSIDEGIIYFSIPLSWITQHGLDPENIVMLHYNSVTGEWEILDTDIISVTGGTVYYRAYTSSFSLFAIGGDSSYHTTNLLGGQPAETPPPTTVATPTKTPVPTSTMMPDNSSGTFPLTYLWIALLILIIASVGFIVLKIRKREEYPDWWFDDEE